MVSASSKRSKDLAIASASDARTRPPAPHTFALDAEMLRGPLLWRCVLVFILRRQLDAWVLGPWLMRGELKRNLSQEVTLSVGMAPQRRRGGDRALAIQVAARHPVAGQVLASGGRLEIDVSPGRFDLLKFGRFLGVGGLAAATNFGSRFAWSLILPFEAAVICAYATGMVLAFILFRLFVFPGSPLPLAVQARNFLVVNVIGASLTFATAFVLVRGLFPLIGFAWHAEAIGHGMAIVVPVATSWIGHRRFTFARS